LVEQVACMIHKGMYAYVKQIGPLMLVRELVPRVVILLRFYALQGDQILCSCSAKIVSIVTDSSPINHAFTRDKILMREGCYKR